MATNTKHIFYKATAIVLIYCISILNTIAQDYKFNHITADQGLSMGSVYCILKDSRGFMWFGTQDGLNKYDGYTIKVFKHNPTDTNTLANNFIYALYEDKNGVLWIGTEGGGLDEYSLITGKFKHHFGSFENKNSLSSNYIHTIFEDDEGLLWLGTEKGLNVYNPKTNEFKRYLADKNNPNAISGDVNSFVHQSKNGKL